MGAPTSTVDMMPPNKLKNTIRYIKDGDFSIVWPNVFIFGVSQALHLWIIYDIVTSLTDNKKMYTWIWSYWMGAIGGLGITAGAHRLWSHRSYEASTALKIFLMIGQSIAGQNSVYVWCRDHRVHHKFSETDGDPHNSNRGFFFAHVGWLMRKKHPEMIEKSQKLTFDDLLDDPIVKFQYDHYVLIYLIFAVFGPSMFPMMLWGETFWRSMAIVYVSRYITSLHSTWFVNSTAHMFGHRPYNEKIQARQNIFVSYGAFGEGYHNYHHSFPWDYATSEMGEKLNLTKKFIDLMAYVGLAYNLKVCSRNVINSKRDKVVNGLNHHKLTIVTPDQMGMSGHGHSHGHSHHSNTFGH